MTFRDNICVHCVAVQNEPPAVRGAGRLSSRQECTGSPVINICLKLDECGPNVESDFRYYDPTKHGKLFMADFLLEIFLIMCLIYLQAFGSPPIASTYSHLGIKGWYLSLCKVAVTTLYDQGDDTIWDSQFVPVLVRE